MTWPEAVWGTPVLRGLDARARAEIEAAGALVTLDDGDRIYGPGEPADDFYVVLDGQVALRARARGEGAARLLREVGRGEVFGEDATLRAGGSRQAEARCTRGGKLARVPALVFARASERGGGGDVAADRRRALARAATLDLLRTMAFAHSLEAADLELLLDAAERVHLARGEALYRQGDPSDRVYFLADGMVQLRTEDDDKLHVRAYLTRGDVVGETEIEDAAPRESSAVAMGATLAIGVPRRVFLEVARRHADLLPAVRRVVASQERAQRAVAAGAHTTQHVFKDLYRLDVARSLLVIDQESCVRCGHCAASCADVHKDGVSRLVRRGDRIVTKVFGEEAPLLLPNSCQHCENPACMPDCPTGAIGRDPRGEVFIREELCTGCGACARGCPWDNIQMAARVTPGGIGLFARRPAASRSASDEKKARSSSDARADDVLPVGTSAEVAVKCDLCHGRAEGPACVASCPTSAIVRIEPSAVLAEVQDALGRRAPREVLARATPAWPLVVGAALFSGSIALVPMRDASSRLGSGVVAGLLLLGLVAYPLVKRLRARLASRASTSRDAPKASTTETTSRLRGHYRAHLVLGVLLAGVTTAHVGAHVHPNLAGALSLAMALALATGVLGGLLYFGAPSLLSRIERKGNLPEDLPHRQRELDERLFRELTGRSDVVKALYRRVLAPYVRSPWSTARLVFSRRTLGDEQRALRAEMDRVLEGRGEGRLDGLDDLIKTAVERVAIPGERLVLVLLRGWLAPHVVLSLVAVVLAAAHAVAMLVYR